MDDAAVDPEESVAMLRAAKTVGVTDIVAAPHVPDASFDFSFAYKRKKGGRRTCARNRYYPAARL